MTALWLQVRPIGAHIHLKETVYSSEYAVAPLALVAASAIVVRRSANLTRVMELMRLRILSSTSERVEIRRWVGHMENGE